MFKDLYKNANDKIPVDDAYLRVMEKVTQKSTKTKYKYAKIASLAACFVLTVSMISVYESSKNHESFDITPKSETVSTVKEQDVTNSDMPENTPVSEPKSTAAPKVKPASRVSSVKILAVAPTVSEEPDGEAPEKDTMIVKNPGAPQTGAALAARLIMQDAVTAEEYSIYLGKNIEETVDLPDEFKSESPKEQILSLEDGDDFNDTWTFYFTDGEGSVFINTTKKTEKIENVLENADYTKSIVSGYEAVVFEEDMQKTAFLAAQGIGYTVEGHNISDDDFEKMLISLTK